MLEFFWLKKDKFYFVASEGVTPDVGVEENIEDLAGRDSAEGNNSNESMELMMYIIIMIVHVRTTHFSLIIIMCVQHTDEFRNVTSLFLFSLLLELKVKFYTAP